MIIATSSPLDKAETFSVEVGEVVATFVPTLLPALSIVLENHFEYIISYTVPTLLPALSIAQEIITNILYIIYLT